MKYETLTTADQQAILTGRLQQLEREHFGHQLLIDQLKASGDTSDTTKDAIKASEDAQKILDSAWTEVKKKITAK